MAPKEAVPTRSTDLRELTSRYQTGVALVALLVMSVLAWMAFSPMLAASEPRTGRFLYAVNQAAAIRGSISVYDIDAEHRLVKTIETVRNVDDVKGVRRQHGEPPALRSLPHPLRQRDDLLP